jgi:hypothetical protein
MSQPQKKTNRTRKSNSASKPAKAMNSNNNKSNKVLVKSNNTKSRVVLSQCAVDYARCTANPFTGPLGCVPSSPSAMSRSVRTFIKGEFRTGTTTGIGYISMDPDNMIANDAAAVFYTRAGSTSTTISTFPLAAGDQLAFSNSEYSLVSFTNNPVGGTYRIVAAALRIRYIGTELNRGGTIIAFVDPTNTPTVGRDASSLLAEECSRKFPVTKSWITIHWRAILSTDYLFETAGPYNASCPLAFYVEAPGGVESVFEYEAACVFEVNGQNVRGMKNTHVDPIAFSGTQQITQVEPSMQPSTVDVVAKERTIVERLAHYIKEGSSHVEQVEEIISKGKGIVEAGIRIGAMFA